MDVAYEEDFGFGLCREEDGDGAEEDGEVQRGIEDESHMEALHIVALQYIHHPLSLTQRGG